MLAPVRMMITDSAEQGIVVGMNETTHHLKDGRALLIRRATPGDLAAINDIYNHYVIHSTCTYQETPESLEDRRAWFDEHDDDYPVIVAEEGAAAAGWASISKYRKREAYRPTVESSVYVRHDCLRRGIGSVLLREAIVMARERGYHSMIAGISAEQKASIVLHERQGFARVARLREVGFKFNTWLDVVYYQLML